MLIFYASRRKVNQRRTQPICGMAARRFETRLIVWAKNGHGKSLSLAARAPAAVQEGRFAVCHNVEFGRNAAGAIMLVARGLSVRPRLPSEDSGDASLGTEACGP
jgi:hypothetical protein